VVFVRK
jgi:hypothetical protein